MAASGTAVGLSGADLDRIRDGLKAGRKPKVVFTASAGQISGQVGQVVDLADPSASDEWVVVRFGRDELPFSPADLAMPSRASRSAQPTPPQQPKPSPEFKLGTPTPRARPKPPPPPVNGTKPAVASPVAKPAEAPPAPMKAKAKVRTPAPLTVTLAYADREWTVAARLGSKALAKPYVIKPADALRLVSLLDVPGVHDAVESIIASERNEAEDRARRLRAELADIEARLAELTRRP
jgi:hypothetical protein